MTAAALVHSCFGSTTLSGEQSRPIYHFTPRRGWMNDPNGMNYRYHPGSGAITNHLFYQANPNDTAAPWSPPWSPAYWGHAVSTDLVRWKEVHASAIRGASGAILVLPQKMRVASGGAIAIATFGNGFWVTHDPDELDWAPPQGCSFTGPPTGKVVCNRTAMNPNRPGIWLVPSEINTSSSIGDPTVAWVGEDGRLYGVYASMRCPSGIRRPSCTYRTVGGRYQALLFRTRNDIDPFSWEFVSIIWEAPPSQRNPRMGFTNCPDFFMLPDGRWAFSYLSHATSFEPTRILWFIGKCTSTWFCTWNEGSGMVDASSAFIASQSFTDSRGRRVIMGWVGIPGYRTGDDSGKFLTGFAGSMSIPRVVVVDKGGSLLRFVPLPELSQLHTQAISFSRSLLPGSRVQAWNVSDAFHLNLSLAVSDSHLRRDPLDAFFGIEILGGQQVKLLPPYSAESQRVLNHTDTDGPVVSFISAGIPSEATPAWCAEMCWSNCSCGAWTLRTDGHGHADCSLKGIGGRSTLGDVGSGCGAEGVGVGQPTCTSGIMDWQLAVPGLKHLLPVVPRRDGTIIVELFVDKVVAELFLHDARGEGASVSTFVSPEHDPSVAPLVIVQNSAVGVLHSSGTLWPMLSAISPSPIPPVDRSNSFDSVVVAV
eukprot:TRINITY_DN68106_c0_g1_i1.p1 TRINITY_DN68106_c0_g1~~TRINITY_DN68106_c0_g1_i1.p1  ORF type:complete len:667 (+),score=42.52 TRINITY_DN68106_c0_g1_i1:54-2003(+)